MDALKFAAAVWLGACIRNEEDRKKTIDFFNSIGNEAEKNIRSLLKGGGNHAQPIQDAADEQEFL